MMNKVHLLSNPEHVKSIIEKIPTWITGGKTDATRQLKETLRKLSLILMVILITLSLIFFLV
jgi:hypothetical protein